MSFPSSSPSSRGRPAPGSPVPEGLPAPRPYAHLGPDDGACLMETASVLAAEPFTDSPRTTDPALAALARTVYDAVGDEARRRLLPLAADLAAARPAQRSFPPSLVADVLCAARAAVRSAASSPGPSFRRLASRQTRCRRRAQRLAGTAPGPFARLRDAVWWQGPGRHHLEHALRVLMRTPGAEDRLVRLLRDAVVAATHGAPAAAPARTDSASATVG